MAEESRGAEGTALDSAEGGESANNDQQEVTEEKGLIGYRAYWTKAKEPSAEWTVCHTVHLCLLGCLVPTLICGAANFGVAVGIFAGEEAPSMWNFPIPIAGNSFAIILIQTFANYVISNCIQLLDVLNGIVPPLEPGVITWWPAATSLSFWWLQPSEILLSPREEPGKWLLERCVDSIVRSGLWILVAELIFWGPFTLIVWGIYGNTNYNDYPQPQWISAILGIILSLVFMPFWQLSCYVTLGQRHNDEVKAWVLTGNCDAPLDEERPRSRLTMYRRLSRTTLEDDDEDEDEDEDGATTGVGMSTSDVELATANLSESVKSEEAASVKSVEE